MPTTVEDRTTGIGRDGRAPAPAVAAPNHQPNHQTISDRTWGAVTAIVLCGVVPSLLVIHSPLAATADPHLWWWPLGVTILTGLIFAAAVGWGRRRLFQLTFAMFTYVFMGLAPLVQLRLNRFANTTPNLDPALMLPAMLVVVAGILAWLVGAWLAGYLPAADLSRRQERDTRTVSPVRVQVFAAVSLLLAVYYSTKLGWRLLFDSRFERFFAEVDVWPNPTTNVLITTICTISMIVPLAALRVLDAQRRRNGQSVMTVRIWTVLLAVGLMVVVNPISSSRYLFGTVAFTLAALFGVVGSPRRFRFFAIAILAGMLLIFPYADRFRYDPSQPANQKGNTISALTTADYDAFGQVNNTVAYVDQLGTTHGRQALGVVLFLVPRPVWPDKPTDTGVLLAAFRGYEFNNLSAPLWSELYINGGWLVLVGGMAAVGAISRRVDDRSLDWRRPLSPLAAILPFYMIILLRGSLLQATLTLSIIAASAFILRPMPGRDPT